MGKIHGATLNANVNPSGLDTTVQFEYGIDETLGTIALVPDVLTGNVVIAVSADITDLLAETPYFFRVSATNSLGTVVGEILTFTTLIDTDVPVVETLDATNVI